MSVPFVITCDTCQARLTVKKDSLVGKRVACPGCQTPMTILAPNEGIGESTSDSVAASLPQIVTSASGISVTASSADVPELSGIPVIREAPKPTLAAKHSAAGKKKGSNTKEKKVLWMLGLGGAGAVVGMIGLIVFLAGPSKQAPPPKVAAPGPNSLALELAKDSPAFNEPAPTRWPQPAAPGDVTPQLADVIEAVGDAIVCITVADQAGQEVALGTGVMFDPAGLLVTTTTSSKAQRRRTFTFETATAARLRVTGPLTQRGTSPSCS